MTTTPGTGTSPSPIPTPAVDSTVIARLRKILALTQSPNENESASAAEMLQKFLLRHNLSVADLESRGAKAAPITETGVDLGKAAFTWKLDLADSIAEHYLCVSIVNRHRKTVTFVGRPDNVESLKLLYAWVIEQIKRLSSEARKQYQAEHGEHIDPLRWQVNFGEGAGDRLIQRLNKRRESVATDPSTTALVLHHSKEISDYTEAKLGRRFDGQMTQAQKEAQAYWARIEAEEKAEEERQDAIDAALLASDPAAYYRQYPERHPDEVARVEAEEYRRQRRRQNYQPRGSYRYRRTDYRKEEQAGVASEAGRRSADRINLEPFIGGHTEEMARLRGGKGGGKGKGK